MFKWNLLYMGGQCNSPLFLFGFYYFQDEVKSKTCPHWQHWHSWQECEGTMCYELADYGPRTEVDIELPLEVRLHSSLWYSLSTSWPSSEHAATLGSCCWGGGGCVSSTQSLIQFLSLRNIHHLSFVLRNTDMVSTQPGATYPHIVCRSKTKR